MSSQSENAMNYRLEENGDGAFQVLEIKPVVVGTFPDREIAKKFMDFLIDGELDRINTPVPDPIRLELPAPRTVPKEPKPQQSQKLSFNARQALLDPWTEDELETAIERLKNGEKLAEVSAEYGKSLNALRANWAVFRKREQQAAQAEAKSADARPGLSENKAAIKANTSANSGEQDGFATCSLCEREFRQTPESLEHCARCRDGS